MDNTLRRWQRERKSMADEEEEEKAAPLTDEEARGLMLSPPVTDEDDDEASVAIRWALELAIVLLNLRLLQVNDGIKNTSDDDDLQSNSPRLPLPISSALSFLSFHFCTRC